ncbi:hypothetical protein [Alloalcanivorax mobilis]|uniref:hypothetical protein n=1 Tax=Alloalcanivorax mobilis TaxID=2019569 RepID=UPI000B5B1854|nr:hypothetical protein [Alloalcanivorax mobilis]ASK34501.1 hypothetical protein CEK62_08940 [Alcanivorax sp. N3-2A]|tara:strand:- start:13467 stop:13985 length:519 start_codon:yes stop_codon:yes gene_type:complete
MKRFYYLTDSIDSVQGISQDLDRAGVGGARVHVSGRDAGPLARARLRASTLLEDTDIMHTGFLGALFGALTGVVLGFALAGLDPWGWQLDLSVVVVTTAFCLCLGAWMGGIFGISSRNHHLRPFWAEVEKGQYLVMVDADDDRQARRIDEMMNREHREVRQVGREDHYSPFD